MGVRIAGPVDGAGVLAPEPQNLYRVLLVGGDAEQAACAFGIAGCVGEGLAQ